MLPGNFSYVLLLMNLVPYYQIALSMDINQSGVLIGQLGEPLGKILVLEGRIVDGAMTAIRSYQDKILLAVNKINNKQLKKNINIPLQIFSWTDIELPEHNTKIKCIGYETGKMEGIPEEAFKYILIVA